MTLNDEFFINALADRANDVILVTTTDAIDAPSGPSIVYCNNAFERMTGWTRSDAMGLTPRILQTRETNRAQLDGIRGALERWRAGDETAEARAELLNAKRGGERFWVDLEIVPIWTPDYERSYWAAIQRDVSDRVQRENVVREALRREEAARTAQEEFLAKMSHEMRTPLNAVIGYSEALEAGLVGRLNDRQADYAADIALAARQLNGLVQDLLDADAITRGALNVRCEPICAHEIVDYVLSVTRPAAERRAIAMRVSGSRHARLHADPIRARQCLTNLIDNAIKFSPKGATVDIAIQSVDDQTAMSVSDAGPGMSDADVKTAVSLFGQVGRAALTPADGVGLGLPITAQLMRLQGGEMHIVSQPGVGSTFSLVFQQARTPDPNPSA